MEQTTTERLTQPETSAPESLPELIDVRVRLPNKKSVLISSVSVMETLSTVRQALGEFQETAFMTNFQWKYLHTEDAEKKKLDLGELPCLEYSELSTYITPTARLVALEVVEEIYDANKVRQHVKHFHSTIAKPYLVSAAIKGSGGEKENSPSTDNEEESEADPKTTKPAEEKKAQQAEKAPNQPPTLQGLQENVDLSMYFSDALLGSFEKVSGRADITNAAPLSEAIKNVSFSGWNPVPMGRRMLGDLVYIEVGLATEGTVYLTATAKGFYVNRCSRQHFDPSPASAPHFSHTLFNTLFSFSGALKTAWQSLCQAAEIANNDIVVPLDSVAESLLLQSENKISKPANSWILPPNPKKTSYDSLRAQEALSDLCGPEELGAAREWNDEIQSISALKPQDFQEKIIKARLEYKIISEFIESCKQSVVAIAEGKIAPLTFTDSSQSDIYVYNGIFFNRGEDNKDTFQICESPEACRKVTARDYENQKLIRSLGIEGISTVLCTIVDYKGVRYVGQSIIPGILTQGEHSAQLMYGLLDKHKNLTVKNSSLKIMQEVAAKLSIKQVSIASVPYGAEESKVEEQKNGPSDPLTNLLQNAESNQQTTIRVDEIDNVPISDDQSIPHIGPVEAKIIKGADSRQYLMEITRLTPRDANYVPEKGTGLIANLDQADQSLLNAYVLRYELVSIFIQRQLMNARQKLLIEASQKEEAVKATQPQPSHPAEEGENKSVKSDEEGSLPSLVDVEEVKIVKDESKKEDQVDDSALSTLASEYMEKLQGITPQSLGLEFNPNVFLNFSCNSNAEELEKDEEKVRDMSKFLWNYVLPLVTKQVREGDICPKDPNSATTLLHRMGVNLRYLGQLATMAAEEERDDNNLITQGKQRVHSMPHFWQEFLVVEMISRACKTVLNTAMRGDKVLAQAPGETVASMLNHVLSLFQSDVEEKSEEEEKKKGERKGNNTKIAPANSNNNSKAIAAEASEEEKKGKKKKKGGKGDGLVTSTVPSLNAFADRHAFLQQLSTTLKQKFLYSFPLLDKALAPPGTTYTETETIQLTVLRCRFSPHMILRRLCQQCGVVIGARKFDYASAIIFIASDIFDMVPRVKTFEPDAYVSEVTDLLNSSASALGGGNPLAAYDYAQQALSVVQQITGLTHMHTLQAADQLATAMISSSALEAGLQMSAKVLSLSAQLGGIDSQDTFTQHMQLATLLMEKRDHKRVLLHLKAARYILEIIGGERHPELMNIYLRMAIIYEECGDVDSTCQILLQARMLSHDLIRGAMVVMTLAQVLFRNKRVFEACEAQKNAFKMLKELLSPEDERVEEAKKTLEVYLRAAAEAKHTLPVQGLGGVGGMGGVGAAGGVKEREKEEERGGKTEGEGEEEEKEGEKKGSGGGKKKNKKNKGKK